MPVFMDTHNGIDLPADLRRTVETRVKNGERDAHGVVDRGIVIDRTSGKMHCILDAPDKAAVMRHHESLNVPLEHETIHQADVILR